MSSSPRFNGFHHKWLSDSRGLSVVELLLALILAAVVVGAAMFILMANEEAWDTSRGKVDVQQETHRCLEEISRDVRAARWIGYDGGKPEELSLYDREGTQFRRYRRETFEGVPRLFQDESPLAEAECTRLDFRINADTTTVTILLELQDEAENRVLFESKATLRNRQFENGAAS